MAIRFIPTHVGNTSWRMGNNLMKSGSSPRMWGTRGWNGQYQACDRFIPTHVGNTTPDAASHNQFARFIPTHVGNTQGISLPDKPYHGSSPRMWGTRLWLLQEGLILRFIPTHVGNTPGGRWRRRRRPVHPHACGEHEATRDSEMPYCGSSPRMWGTPGSR